MRLKQFLLIASSLLCLQGFAQKKQKQYAWDYAVIKRLEKHDSSVIAFQRQANLLVNLAVVLKNEGTVYYFTKYGYLFDSLHVKNEQLAQLISKQIDAFSIFQENASGYLKILQAAKELLRAEEKQLLESATAVEAVFALNDVKQAKTGFKKMLAIEGYEKAVKLRLSEFDWNSNAAADTLIEQQLQEGKKPRSVITYKSATKPYTEYINADSLSYVRRAAIIKGSNTIYFYGWHKVLIDSIPVQKQKMSELLREKTDVFSLYRGWLEWKIQNLSDAARNVRYEINRQLIRSINHTTYAAYTYNTRQHKETLHQLKGEIQIIHRKIDVLNTSNNYLLHKYIFAKKYKGQTVTKTWMSTLGWGYNKSFERGRKEYELSNHLGNVLVTISDKTIQHDDDANDKVDWYEADVISAQDYYPFGMKMPERQYVSSTASYRYGFNGKEEDDEVKGDGNQQDYGMRIYDPRIGRFLSVDPLYKEYPYKSTYDFSENSPIANIDLDGEEKKHYTLTYDSQGNSHLKFTKTEESYSFLIFWEKDYDHKINTIHYNGNTYNFHDNNHNYSQVKAHPEWNYGADYHISDQTNFIATRGAGYISEERITEKVFTGAVSGAAEAIAVNSSTRGFYRNKANTTTASTNKQVIAANGGNAEAAIANVGASAGAAWKGPVDYTVLPEPRNVGPGKKFTQAQHKNIIEHNKKTNGGVLRDDETGQILNPAKQDKKGVPSDMNSAQVDHKDARKPKDKTKTPGSNSNANAAVRSKAANVKKSNN